MNMPSLLLLICSAMLCSVSQVIASNQLASDQPLQDTAASSQPALHSVNGSPPTPPHSYGLATLSYVSGKLFSTRPALARLCVFLAFVVSSSSHPVSSSAVIGLIRDEQVCLAERRPRRMVTRGMKARECGCGQRMTGSQDDKLIEGG